MPGDDPICREQIASVMPRRTVLAGSLSVLVTTACTGSAPTPPSGAVTGPTDLDAALSTETQLLDRCSAALASPGGGERFGPFLTSVRAAHAQHRSALLAAGASDRAPASTATPAPLRSTRVLAALEELAAAQYHRALPAASLADVPLLASLAASAAAHAALLRARG